MRRFDTLEKIIKLCDRERATDHDKMAIEIQLQNQNAAKLIGMLTFIVDHVFTKETVNGK